MRTQSPLIVFFWWHLKLRCSMPASHETASSPCPSPNSTFLPRQYQESRLEDNPACCSTFTNWKPAHSRNTGPTFQESLLSGSPVIFWSYRLLSPQDWLGANLELTLLLIPHRCAELNCLTLQASLLQPERSRRVCSSSCTLLRHSLAYIHLLRLFFISFTDFSDASKCLQGTYPTLRSPPTLLGHCAAWPEGLRRACASTPKAENHFSLWWVRYESGLLLPHCSSPSNPSKDKPTSMCHPDDQMLLQELHGSVACSLPIPLIPYTRPQFKLIGLKTNGEKSQLIPAPSLESLEWH